MSCESTVAKACTRQGSTRNLSVGFADGSVITGDWTCYLQVRVKSTNELTTIDRAVSTLNGDSTKFITTLTAAETGALTVGTTYIVALEMQNSSTGETMEGLLELDIEKQWVVRP